MTSAGPPEHPEVPSGSSPYPQGQPWPGPQGQQPYPAYPQQPYHQPYPAPYPQQGWAPAPPRPSFPHAEPREYHEMYRTWTYRWWKPVLGIITIPVAMSILLPLVFLPVLGIGLLVEGGTADLGNRFERTLTQELTPSGLLYLNLALGSLILWTWGLVRVLHSLRPRWLSSVVPKLRWKFLFVCLGLSVVALTVSFVMGLFLPTPESASSSDGTNPWNGTMLALVVIIVLTTPLQAAGEEYAFRGYLLQATGSLLRNRWITIVVTALLFAVAHLQFEPPVFFDRFVFGVIAAWLVIRTGGLEAGIALHVLNNYLAMGWAVAFGDLSQALSAPEANWWNVPVSLTQSLVYAALVAAVAQRMGVQTRTRPPASPAASRQQPSLL
ncbi:type II CAAX prenyl endopeptidase Rce1 family protein [Nocardioides caldifontis]|uniref:CPBP family glutamic-type intramembrane protease n=1 Tax=Nocardioides caldifontis TaxID=2588938 RepID=UPI0011DF2403|nr:CPBP family glutamic-type intramembrane protease [Nocardioides caldifontis]